MAGSGNNSTDFGDRTECAVAGARDSKQKYAKSSARSQGFPFQLLENSPRHDMHLFHVQRVQALQPDDYAPRIAFAHLYLGN